MKNVRSMISREFHLKLIVTWTKLVLLSLSLSCGFGNSGSGGGLEEFILAILGGASSSNPSTSASSPLAGTSPNSPNVTNPPDEVLVTNPPPPQSGDLVAKPSPGGGPVLNAIGPKLEIKIDNLDYTLASNFNFFAKQINTQENKIASIKNVGDENLTVSFVQISSAGSQFTFQNTHAFTGNEVILSPNASRSFTIRFLPNAGGLRKGTMVIQSNDPNLSLVEMELLGSGTSTPSAAILKPATAVSRHQKIVLEFSHEMDRGSICPNADLVYPGSNSYSEAKIRIAKDLASPLNPSVEGGRCRWTGFRQLELQPYQPLDELSTYYISLADARLHPSISGITSDGKLYCLGLANASCSTTKIAAFLTEPKFNAEITINTKKIVGLGEAGLILEKANHPTVTMSSSISNSASAAYIRLRKVGALNTSFANWSPSINLTTISPLDLRVADGSNGYFLEISYGGKLYYRNFSFSYGNTQSNPMASTVAEGGRLTIGSGNLGLEQIGLLLEKFFLSNGSMLANSGMWRLDNKIFSEGIIEHVADTSSNCPRIKELASITGIKIGMVVRGKSIPPNTFVTAISNSGSWTSTGSCSSSYNTGNRVQLSQNATNSHGDPGNDIKFTFGPDTIKLATGSAGSSTISFSDNTDLSSGVFISGAGIPEGSKLLNFVTGTTWTLSTNLTANISSTTVNVSPAFLQGLRRTSLPISDGNCLNNTSDFFQFSWMPNYGPFCDIAWSWGGGLASGRTDVYVTNISIERTAPGDPNSRNLIPQLTPNSNHLGISVQGKRLRGTLRAHIHSVNFIAGLAGAGNSIYEIDFIMNFDGASCADGTVLYNYSASKPFRNTLARSNINIPSSNGLIDLAIQNPPWNSPSNADFNVAEWDSAICAHNVITIRGGWLNDLVTAILGSVIPNIKWRIVQGIIRDVIQTITPNILNGLFSQLRLDALNNGIGVKLPEYLPPPFDRTKLFIGANLRQNSTNRTGSDGLDLGADIGILSCINPNTSVDTCLPTSVGISTLPALHSGTGFQDSFLLTSSTGLPKSQLSNGTVNGNNGTGLISSHPGVLLAVKMDVINQVLYSLWKRGVFELSLNQDFADKVQAYRGSGDRLFQIFQILLKADSILKVLAPGQSEVFYGQNPSDVIQGSDDIIFRLLPMTPPNLNTSSLVYSKLESGGRKFPLADIEWNDLRIKVFGKRSNNTEYLITTLKVNFKSRAGINIHNFSSPVSSGVNNFQNVTSIQLNVCDDNTSSPSSFDCDLIRTSNGINDDLVYSLEVLDNPVDNPLGLDPRGIYEVLNPSVQKLILPVVNFVLEELPLERKSFSYPSASFINEPGTREDPNQANNKIMANCGIRLNNMSIKPIPSTEANPYIMIHTELLDYVFSGNCEL